MSDLRLRVHARQPDARPSSRSAEEDGYTVHVVYLWLPSIEFALARVAERVRAGGHDVPAETVGRRYTRGRRNFFSLYRALADRWRVYDGSALIGPALVATGGRGVPTRIRDPHSWELVAEGYEHG
jgi:predicted ABC-type ATPase